MGLINFFLVCLFRWSLIAGRLPGRTDNEIKNYWNTHIRRKLLNRGIDPASHRPINEAAAADQDAATTISFGATVVKEEKPSTIEIFGGKDIKTPPVQEKCPDLNLELRISPPSAQNQPLKSLCFSCSLGLQNSKDCSCRINV